MRPYLLAGSVMLLSGMACLQISGIGDFEVSGEAGGGATGASGGQGGQGAATTGGGGSAGGGGSGECAMPSDCPDPLLECRVATCQSGECGDDVAPEGDACNNGQGGIVCRADGECVECIVTDDCETADSACQGNICVPNHCTNGIKDAAQGETDTDCGGAFCAGCALTKSCLAFDDCLSGVCTGSVCAICDNDGECTVNVPESWCNAATNGGTCEATKGPGLGCVTNGECNSATAPGGCADGFCCDSPCDTTCDGCAQNLTGAANGKCAQFIDGIADPACPEASCISQTMALSAATCQAGTCVGSVTTCVGGNICAGGACLTGCANDAECTADTWCDESGTGDCVDDLISGSACVRDAQCISGGCNGGLCL